MFNLINAIITWIQDTLQSIFFSSSPEYQKKKKLKECAAEIKKLSPPLYRTDKVLLPAFAALLYQLYHFLQPIKGILEKTVCSPDIRAVEKYQDMFFAAAFTDEQKQLRQTFSFTERNTALSRCKKYEDIEQQIQEQIHEFKNFIKIFQDKSYQAYEERLIKLFFLFDLCTFNYAALLEYFNKNIQLTPTGGEHAAENNFQEVFAEDVMQNLLDFQFIIKQVAIDASTVNDVIFFAENTDGFTEELKQKITKTLQTVEVLLSQQLKRTTIPLILKLIKDDPDFEEQMTCTEMKLLQEYLDHLCDSFQADTKRLQKIYKENTIKALIEKCFGKTPLKPLDGYNETMNDAIQSLSTISFDWVKPLQLLQAFTERYFEVRYKPFLNSVLIEGFFSNKQIETRYSTLYRSCETLLARIKTFEQLFKTNGQCSVQEIKGYIAGIEQGRDFKKPLQKMVEIANMQAKTIVQSASKTYADLYTLTGHFVEDIKTAAPEFITNIKALTSSSKNRESFLYLEQDRPIFAQFLEIMKNYAVFGPIEQGRNTPAEKAAEK